MDRTLPSVERFVEMSYQAPPDISEVFKPGQLVKFNPKCKDFNLPPGKLDSNGYRHVNTVIYLRPYVTSYSQDVTRFLVDVSHYGLVIEMFPHGPRYSPPRLLYPNYPAVAVLFESGTAIVSPHYITKV